MKNRKGRPITIDYYRWAGRFLFFRIRNRCVECDMTYVLLNRLMADTFVDHDIILRIQPWLNNIWHLFFRGVWHAPAVLVNNRIFAMKTVPRANELILHIARLLDDPELENTAEHFVPRVPAPVINGDTVVYHSPSCPHCRQLIAWLESQNVVFTRKNVQDHPEYRDEMLALTGTLVIPVFKHFDEVVSGFDREKIRGLLSLTEEILEEGSLTPSGVEPGADPEALARTLETAKLLLKENRSARWTRASRHLYPHQWNWDAGFISRGYLNFDPPRAYQEMDSLFSGQWSDGFLPHIIFNPEYANHFPGSDYWKSERSGRVPPGILTSGISQPPVHASMMVRATKLDPEPDRARLFLKKLYPRLKGLHDFYRKHRDPDGESIVYLVHPWESGLDNSPLWDEALSRLNDESPWSKLMQRTYDELAEKAERPKRSYINKYSWLIENLFSKEYDWKAVSQDHPFVIQDVLFNSVLCRAEKDLALIAEIVGEDPEPHLRHAEDMARAINDTLWDDEAGLYYDRDLYNGELIRRDTIFSYMPLYAGIVPPDRAERLLWNLKSHCFCIADRNCVGIPSYDMCQADFDGSFYWRGPIWFNMNWYMIHGLRNYGWHDDARWLKNSMLDLVDREGFFEYYEPETGKGLGADGFSWTAALFIDLVSE